MTNFFFPEIRGVQHASGLVYTLDKTIEVPAQWKYDEQRRGVILSVILPKNFQPQQTFVSGVVVDDKSQLTLGPVARADFHDPETMIPMCGDSVGDNLREGQEGLFKKLVEVRERRIEVAEKKMKETISPKLFQRLRELENAFSLRYTNPLTPDLPIEELAERLDVLYYTIKRYDFYKTNKAVQAALDSRQDALAQSRGN